VGRLHLPPLGPAWPRQRPCARLGTPKTTTKLGRRNGSSPPRRHQTTAVRGGHQSLRPPDRLSTRQFDGAPSDLGRPLPTSERRAGSAVGPRRRMEKIPESPKPLRVRAPASRWPPVSEHPTPPVSRASDFAPKHKPTFRRVGSSLVRLLFFPPSPLARSSIIVNRAVRVHPNSRRTFDPSTARGAPEIASSRFKLAWSFQPPM